MASRGPDKKLAASVGVSLEEFDTALKCFENALRQDGCSPLDAVANARELIMQSLPMIRLLGIRANTLWALLVEALERKQALKVHQDAKKDAKSKKGKKG